MLSFLIVNKYLWDKIIISFRKLLHLVVYVLKNINYYLRELDKKLGMCFAINLLKKRQLRGNIFSETLEAPINAGVLGSGGL